MADDPQTPAATAVAPQPDPEPAAPPPADEPLGDGGKRALEAERKAARDALKRAEAAEKELAKARESQMTEQEKAVAKAKAEGRAEALAQSNARLVAAEVRAAAAGKFANPALAIKLLDVSQITVADDGTVDNKAIESQIEDLLKDNPGLAANASRPSGTVDAGARSKSPNTFTTSQIEDRRFYEEHRDDIFRAMQEGRIVKD